MQLVEKLRIQRVKAVMSLLQVIAELELASAPNRAEIDRLNAELNFLLSEEGTSPVVSESP